MSRLTDALATIGKPLEEEREQSPLDMVKSFLKGAALTTVAGAVGGTAGMSALGGYVESRTKAKRQRRLDEISRAKEMIAAARDEAAINASEANIQEGKERVKLAEKEAFDRAIERTQREQQDMRLIKFKSEEEAKDRELRRQEMGFKSRNAVEEAKRKLAAGQESDAKRRVGQITKAVSQFPIDPAAEEQAQKDAATIAQILRTEFKVQTADQAAKTWDDLTRQGMLDVSPRVAPVARQKVIDFFAADDLVMKAQNRQRAGLPVGPMPEPNAGFINNVVANAPVMPDETRARIFNSLAGNRPRGGSLR